MKRRFPRIRTIEPDRVRPARSALLIGQLAVDHRYAGQGIGSGLVKDVLRRCVAGAGIVAGCAVVVRAIDAEAERYWQSWGFVPSRDNPSILMRSIQYVSLWAAEGR
ncbi:GNAT family N-acetyltransferase [Mesorhizobium sp. M7D.F.Ca.US.004.01.2.1]|uniref:GNAT family N-acetyltransferase n=1 Tax=Mesorhizobium sp. M7D.F.Ca.US.004.01.2.1 TaxID=2496738 RepID=UPI001FDEB064|nr:GNAT family N-acetyltransferase [Mesorhizobium sp. M7D.F.Ca.US.004.01.2.1]